MVREEFDPVRADEFGGHVKLLEESIGGSVLLDIGIAAGMPDEEAAVRPKHDGFGGTTTLGRGADEPRLGVRLRDIEDRDAATVKVGGVKLGQRRIERAPGRETAEAVVDRLLKNAVIVVDLVLATGDAHEDITDVPRVGICRCRQSDHQGRDSGESHPQFQ